MQLTNYNGEKRVSESQISTSLEIERDSLKKIIKKYSDKIEAFGIIGFEIRKSNKAGRPQKEYLFNQDQAMFIGTLASNTAKVVEFKKALVEAFSTKSNNLTLSTLDILELATGEIKKLQAERDLLALDNTRLSQRDMVIHTRKEYKYLEKEIKNDMGRNINYYVRLHFYPMTNSQFTEPKRYSEAHRLAKETCLQQTGVLIPNPIEKASKQLKSFYLGWLSTFKPNKKLICLN